MTAISRPARGSRMMAASGRAIALCAFIAFLVSVTLAVGAEKLPPAPEHYFNDYAHAVSSQTAAQLDRKLEEFEKQTSNQIVVAIYPKLETDSAMEDFTQRTAQSWRVGQKLHNNGVVLFIFTQARKMRIEVGYGLEGALPDLLAKQIIDNEMKPAFQAGKFDAGVTAGVNAIMQATQGEYKGTGATRGKQSDGSGGWTAVIVVLFIAFFIFRAFRSVRNGTTYGSRGRGYYGGFSSFGGWGGGGGSSGGGGGGFSGGGGSFGGGGASGGW